MYGMRSAVEDKGHYALRFSWTHPSVVPCCLSVCMWVKEKKNERWKIKRKERKKEKHRKKKKRELRCLGTVNDPVRYSTLTKQKEGEKKCGESRSFEIIFPSQLFHFLLCRTLEIKLTENQHSVILTSENFQLQTTSFVRHGFLRVPRRHSSFWFYIFPFSTRAIKISWRW